MSFEIADGDRLALMGRNGSGKTTLLRTLAGIYEPVAGTLAITGRVVPLFDIALGMDPDSTGLENIWLRARMLGLDAEEIARNIGKIAVFCELGDYLYMPIRTYSSGMLVRLAFAVSTAITLEILLLDEMIGAGDASFLESAERRLKAFIESAGIMAIASHSVAILRQSCNRGMVLDLGQVAALA